MELIIFIAIVILICIVVGVSAEMILLGSMLFLLALLLFITVFFLVSIVRLALSKPCKGEFAEIRKNIKGNFETAFYSVENMENAENEEYPNIFPCEIIFRNRLYKKGKKVNLRMTRNHKVVFDKNAVITTLAGIVLGIFSVVFVTLMIFQMI